MTSTSSFRQKISVVVPVYNERGNLLVFHRRLSKILKSTRNRYEIIYIDDHSTDGSMEYLEGVADGKVVRVYEKVGPVGKAFSLNQGFSLATGSVFVMIDADLQYPPDAIPDMIAELQNNDIVVANRQAYRASPLRHLLTKGFRFVFGKLLFGLNTDIQSGLKVFTREVFDTVAFSPSSPWTFDLEFLFRALEAGFLIGNYDITFSSRVHGDSKINMVQASWEIGLNALQVRRRKLPPLLIPPSTPGSMRGAGVGHRRKKYFTHTTLHSSFSAFKTFTGMQKFLWVGLIFLIIGGFVFSPLLTARIIVGVLSVLYLIDTIFNLFLVLRSLHKPEELHFSDEELSSLSDAELPVYTILCPLYKEAHVIPQFLEAISRLEWPREKLDVMLLLEEDDKASIKAVERMSLPAFVRTVVVPHSMPKTKPKACNYGLSFAQGEYLVIYDAEDMPDPLQLKKAYLGFIHSPENVRCLQAKLNYYNPRQNLLTRFFTAEYSLWFDLTLTGLQSFRSTIPLGGTSNHFRTADLLELQGWDPFNVTEDADLGVRLFQRGYQTAIIDSTTLEEANSKVKNWIRQRSRWIKGYMQTYLVHTRDFSSFLKNKGIKHNFIFQLTVGGKLLFIVLNPLLWITTLLYFVFYPYVAPVIEMVYIPPISYIAVFSWVFGNFLFLYYYMIGCAKRGEWDLVKYVFLIPVYWAMMSYAAGIAFWQLLFKPHYWEKTVHGFHLLAQVVEEEPEELEVENYAQDLVEKPEKIAAYRVAAIAVWGVARTLVNNLLSLRGLLRISFFEKEERDGNLRILIFNWRDTKHIYAGGAEVYTHELARRWVQDGNQVTVFCGNDNNNSSNEIIDGVEIVRRGGSYTVYFFAFIYYLFHFRRKFDVIIDCENGIPFFTPLYVRKPIVLLVHHVHREIFRVFLPFPLAVLAKFLESHLMPLFYRNRTVVTVSDSSRKEIFKLGFTNSENIEIIHNGVSTNGFASFAKTTYPSFMYLGRLKGYKHIDVAIKAFAKVLVNHPDARLSIVGYGESYPELKALVSQLGIARSVSFLGRVSEEEKAKLLVQHWVVLQPSQVEGWGLTVIEANAAGTPVIASRVNGLKDSVVDGETGILVEQGNVKQFAAAMYTLVEQSDYRIQLSQGAYAWSKNFNWDKSARDFYMVINQSLQVVEAGVEPSYAELLLQNTPRS